MAVVIGELPTLNNQTKSVVKSGLQRRHKYGGGGGTHAHTSYTRVHDTAGAANTETLRCATPWPGDIKKTIVVPPSHKLSHLHTYLTFFCDLRVLSRTHLSRDTMLYKVSKSRHHPRYQAPGQGVGHVQSHDTSVRAYHI